MTFYKVIIGEMVVDVGFTFIRINTRDRPMYCDVDDAQLVQGWNPEKLYHTDWLLPMPGETGVTYENGEVVIIQRDEYDELYELLTSGEEVPEPTPEPEPEPEPTPEPEPEPEHKMTVQEMREKIAELTALVMNESKPFTATKSYMKGEMITDGSRIYRATRAIVRGETVVPGENCEETSIAEVLTALQAQA